mgnify:CR=1 FL=1
MASKRGPKKPPAEDRTVGIFSGKTAEQQGQEAEAAAATEQESSKKSGTIEPRKLPLTWVDPDFIPKGAIESFHLARLESGAWVMQKRYINKGTVYGTSDFLISSEGFRQLVTVVREAVQTERKARGLDV